MRVKKQHLELNMEQLASSKLGKDCSHEIKRCLLLGRKAMTNGDSISKSSDINLPTKVYTIKAMMFPVSIGSKL